MDGVTEKVKTKWGKKRFSQKPGMEGLRQKDMQKKWFKMSWEDEKKVSSWEPKEASDFQACNSMYQDSWQVKKDEKSWGRD